MNRTPLQRKGWLNARPKTAEERRAAIEEATLARTGFKRKLQSGDEKPSQLRAKPLRRTAMKRKKRRPKPGDEPRYKAWIKTQACCVGGQRCGKADPHHLIDGNGDARKGMSQTTPDRFLLPMCRVHHDLFHAGKGIFAHFDQEQRLIFQEQECERLRAIWFDLETLGILQEPARRAV
jgi:hypothetical protein